MTEISFARSFLAALDLRPTKLDSNYVSDPRGYPAQSAYILPKLPNQPQKRKRGAADPTGASAPGSEAAVTVTLKNMKTSETVTLQRQALTSSIFDIKSAYAQQTGGALDKTKILYSKKPVPDSKTLKDVIGAAAAGGKEVAFTVMVMGGAAVKSPDVEMADTAPVAQGTSGVEVLESETFWDDLRGFLLQRIRDEAEAKKLTGVFREAWKSSQ